MPGNGQRTRASDQAVFLALVEQRFTADAENIGGLANFVMRRFQCGPNRFPLQILERLKRAAGS